MNAQEATARYGCTHSSGRGCPWCTNPNNIRAAAAPLPASPRPPSVASSPEPLPLWEQIEKNWPGFWATPTTGGAA